MILMNTEETRNKKGVMRLTAFFFFFFIKRNPPRSLSTHPPLRSPAPACLTVTVICNRTTLRLRSIGATTGARRNTWAASNDGPQPAGDGAPFRQITGWPGCCGVPPAHKNAFRGGEETSARLFTKMHREVLRRFLPPSTPSCSLWMGIVLIINHTRAHTGRKQS